MMQDCKKSEGASDKDVEDVLNLIVPESKEGKCMCKCLQEQFGLVDNGLFQKETYMGYAEMVYGNDDAKMKQVEEIADECLKDQYKDPDGCEYAYKIGHCMKKEAEVRKMSYDFGEDD